MDFINKVTGGGEPNKEAAQQDASGSGGGLMGQFNSMAGGGKDGEKNEDGLDKGEYICAQDQSPTSGQRGTLLHGDNYYEALPTPRP